jgi:cobalt-zinc-cadmium efflux system protein
MGRAEVLSAQANGATLLVLAAIIAVEGVSRLTSPPDVDGLIVVIVGSGGVGINLAAAWALSKAQRRSINVEGARQHILTDLYAAFAAVAAGLIVIAAGFREADGIAALVVAGLMLRSGWALVRDSGRVLMESAPKGFDPEEIGMAMAGYPGVVEVHDLHVWEVTTDFPALAAHVMVPAGRDCHELRRELDRMLADRFGIRHVTLQVEHAPRAHELLQIEENA